MIRNAILTLIATSALFGQGTVQGPVVGWVYDRANASLRPVLGIPGSSLLGKSLEVGFELSQATVAPGGRTAIGSASDGRMVRVDLRGSAGSSPISGVEASADGVVFSASGSAALLVYRSAGKVVVLPNGGESREISFGAEMPESFAISDDGALVLGASAEQLMAVDASGNRWNLNFSGGIGEVSFATGSHDALVANGRGLWLIRDAAANAESRLVWEGNARQVLLAADRKSALVLTGELTLMAVEMETGASSAIECSCEPQLLARMSDSVIRVTGLSEGPLWMVDWSSAMPRAVFVPAEVKSEQ